jgi:4a-hydroxytetrahydrobiopterin dehydratase
MSVLLKDEIARRLEKLPGWHDRGDALEKHFDRGNFDGSIAFVNAVAKTANEQNHHPDITISWSEVALTLSSHDAGGITERDFRLAEAIDALASG